MNLISRRQGRRQRAVASFAIGALALTALGAGALPASAHDGVDHPPGTEEPGTTPPVTTPGDTAAALDWSNYEKVLLTKNVGEPIDLAVMPDSKVLHTARNGDVRLTDPATGVTKVVNTIPVYANSEDGLQTVALDPDFEENNWV